MYHLSNAVVVLIVVAVVFGTTLAGLALGRRRSTARPVSTSRASTR